MPEYKFTLKDEFGNEQPVTIHDLEKGRKAQDYFEACKSCGKLVLKGKKGCKCSEKLNPRKDIGIWPEEKDTERKMYIRLYRNGHQDIGVHLCDQAGRPLDFGYLYRFTADGRLHRTANKGLAKFGLPIDGECKLKLEEDKG